MTNRTTKTYLISLFAMLGASQLLALQSQTPTVPPAVTVSGCVMQVEKNGSLADETGTGISSTPTTAPVDANTAQPVNAYQLTSADRIELDAEDSRKDAVTSYALVGHELELEKHKGHRIEITGKLMPPRPPTGTTAGKSAASNVRRISVDTIKMVSTECPAQK
jgi:hypothetical protein